ncbi:MAG: DUF1015 family protein [Fuerstiella sp.]|nr:DUF1015 family protein [Fuerstiella sp.]
MPRIQPFNAIRPAREHAASVASVPYDVVSRSEAVAMAKDNPLSFLHVIRPEIDLPEKTDPYADEVYAAGRAALDRLLSESVLQRDPDRCLYAYRQIMNGMPQVGLVCCCHVDDYTNDLIRKHEKTRPAKEDDRTRHVMTLNAHAGPVFLSYRSAPNINTLIETVVQTQPLYDFTAEDGVEHTVWKITEPDPYLAAFSAVPVFYVADGHHRSASAMRAATLRRNTNEQHTGTEEYNWFLSVLFPSDQLRILSYNRVVRDLNGLTATEFQSQLTETGLLEKTSSAVPAAAGSFCIYFGSQWHRLTIPDESIDKSNPVASLDVAILEDRVLRPILGIQDVRTDSRIDFVGGVRGTDELEKLVDSGNWAVAVSMYPTSMEQLMNVSDAGRIMPPKSTWFEPKLRSGLLVHSLD